MLLTHYFFLPLLFHNRELTLNYLCLQLFRNPQQQQQQQAAAAAGPQQLQLLAAQQQYLAAQQGTVSVILLFIVFTHSVFLATICQYFCFYASADMLVCFNVAYY